jgi:hypothetical protein
MIFTIHKGKHRSKPRKFSFWWGKDTFRWQVLFTPSCRYDLKSIDQLDINKLVGVGYLPTHHRESARFGWRYNNKTDRVEVFTYCYVGWKRVSSLIQECVIGRDYVFTLIINPQCYHFFVIEGDLFNDIIVPKAHNRKFQYRLGTYFGGNEPAPHDIRIKIKAV